MPATSLPERGSVTPAPPKRRPSASGRSHCSFCSSVPKASSEAPTSPEGMETTVPRMWQVFDTSSMRSAKVTKSSPMPPSSSGSTPPKKPRAAILSRMSRGIFSSRS